MKNYDRIFVIVLDSLGIGAMPDSANFGDTGVELKQQITVFPELHLILRNPGN